MALLFINQLSMFQQYNINLELLTFVHTTLSDTDIQNMDFVRQDTCIHI